MKALYKVIVLMSLCFIVSSNAYALPMGWDLYVDGSTRVITTDTGTQWLSPVTSDGMSWNDVVAAQNAGDSTFDGYQRATTTEFLDLLSSYGIINTGGNWTTVSPEQDALSDAFQADFGLTLDTSGLKYTYGMLVDENGDQARAMVASADSSYSNPYYWDKEFNGVFIGTWGDADSSSPAMGQWLISGSSSGGNPNPVPEPSTYILLSSGLIALTCYRRKYRKN